MWTVALVATISILAACPADRPRRPPTSEQKKPKGPPAIPSTGPIGQKVLYEQGKSLLRAGKPQQAIKLFRRAIKVAPGGRLVANCYLGIGSALGELRRFSRAVEAYKQVVALESRNPEAYRALAIGQEDAGQLKEAQQSLGQALAIDPDQLSAYQDLAALHLKDKDMAGAKKVYLRYELRRTFLIKTLGMAKDVDQRVAAAQVLGEARDEATTKALGLALTDRHLRVRLAVIRALGQQGLSQSVGPLKARLARATDGEERRLIQISLNIISKTPQPGQQPAPTPLSDERGEAAPGKPSPQKP